MAGNATDLGLAGVPQAIRSETYSGKTLYVAPTFRWTSLSLRGTPGGFVDDGAFEKGVSTPVYLFNDVAVIGR